MPNAKEKADFMGSLVCLLLVWGAIALMAWMQESDRQAAIFEACLNQPNLEVCKTLTKEK